MECPYCKHILNDLEVQSLYGQLNNSRIRVRKGGRPRKMDSRPKIYLHKITPSIQYIPLED